MKVALLIYTYSPESGGVERAAGYLAGGLLARDNEVHVFAKRIAGAANGVRSRPVRARSILPGGRHVAYARNVKRMLLQEKFDIIHSFTRTLMHDVIRLGGGTHREYLLRMERERSALGAWATRINPKERAILRLEKQGFARGHYRRIVAVSNRVKEEVVRHYGVPADDIVVIHNAVDTARFTPELRETARPRVRKALALGDDLTLLFCGAGFRRKGLRYAIESVARVPGARLLVVGGGNSATYREQARKLGARVHFLGPRSGVEQIYAAADLLIHPSLYDPFPNVCLEAMACGTPVLTTEVTGVAEIIRDGENSFVVPHASDVDAMVERVGRLAPQMGEAAAATARGHTLERNLEENLDLYRQLAR